MIEINRLHLVIEGRVYFSPIYRGGAARIKSTQLDIRSQDVLFFFVIIFSFPSSSSNAASFSSDTCFVYYSRLRPITSQEGKILTFVP